MNLAEVIARRRPWRRDPVVSVLRFEGVIAPRPRRGTVSLSSHAAAIERAFRPRRLAAVAVVVNSPGGSPVQSALITRRIRQLAEEKRVPVFAFAEDVAASGGYWLALCGDEIYSEEASLLGSIGVISAGFGVPELLARLGIERRVHTAGERKSLLDPFLPENPADVERVTALQRDIHESFKEQVRARRAGKIDPADDSLFSGEVYGEHVRLLPVPAERLRWPLIGRRRFGTPAPFAPWEELLDWLEARLAWARFGL
jgi:ClpP class serine protease